MNNSFVSVPTILRGRNTDGAWTLAKIGALLGATLAIVGSVALAGSAFLDGIVVESTAAAEARSQVANAALGNAVGLVLLAFFAGAAALAGCVARERLRWILLPSLLLSICVLGMDVSVSHQVDQARCMMERSQVTPC